MLCEILVRKKNSITQEEAADENMYPTKIIKSKSNMYLNCKKLCSRDPGSTNTLRSISGKQIQTHLLWRQGEDRSKVHNAPGVGGEEGFGQLSAARNKDLMCPSLPPFVPDTGEPELCWQDEVIA